jgi:hypothetical protein
MPINSVFSWFIKKRVHQIELFCKYPSEVQEELWAKLVAEAALTEFGKEHGFSGLKTLADYKKAVPVRSYEGFKPYIERLREGEQGILWPSKVRWFAKSSGTTSDKSKYIPVSKEALDECHYKGGKDLLAMYYHQREDARLYSGKHLVMGGSSKIMPYSRDCYTGDLSAIIIKNLPLWVELRRTPSLEIALLDNWEEKIERMARATIEEDITTVAGVPSWTLVLFKRILEITGKSTMHEVWPNLQMVMHGGVSFKPYREQFDALLSGRRVDYLESYNASEGFFGVQDRVEGDDMLLMLDYGIFYEFMPMEEYGKEYPSTLQLHEVELGVNYALLITTNAGLWRYLIGDTIKFTSKDPYRIQVSGRTKHFINAFGEELIVENADEAIRFAAVTTNAMVSDYSAAPIYMSSIQTGGHEWLIEFTKEPADMPLFTHLLDQRLKEVNTDYAAKRTGNLTLNQPILRSIPPGTFYAWMASKGKLGGQHKVPRLFNDRTYVEDILSCVAKQY